MSTQAKHIALVGCGNWGRHILRDLKTLGARVTVVAISDATITRAREGGADAIVDCIGSLPQHLDGAVVATSTDTHTEAVLALAERNIPIFVEKPLAASVSEAQRVVQAAGDRVFVMHKWRYHPGIECLRRVVAEGRPSAFTASGWAGRCRTMTSIRFGRSCRMTCRSSFISSVRSRHRVRLLRTPSDLSVEVWSCAWELVGSRMY